MTPPSVNVEEDTLHKKALGNITSAKLIRGQIIHAGVKLGIIDYLQYEPVSVSKIAEELDLDKEYSYRLLRALTAFDIVEQNDEDRFSITPLGEFFQEDHPENVRDSLLLYGSSEFLSAIRHLPEVIEEGGPNGFVQEFGCGVFEYAEENPEFDEVFNGAMTVGSRQTTNDALSALDEYDFSRFSGISHVCGIGGGEGHLIASFLRKYPHIQGTVLDRPEVFEGDGELCASKMDVEDRCEYIGGDMFESIPTADVYLIKYVLNDWGDEKVVQILSNAYESASENGSIFILEDILPKPGEGDSEPAKWIDILAMVLTSGGQTRTESEYASLLEEAGWTSKQKLESPTGSISAIQGVKQNK